jgi:hypothetical protein
MKKTRNAPIKIGFDLDGVLLYNPTRTLRPIVAYIKQNILQKKQTKFFYPQTKLQQAIFRLFHFSSFMTAPGFEIIRELVAQEKIEAYLVTARFAYLKKDLDTWLQKVNGDVLFKGVYYNKRNQQPHIYKSHMIEKLHLDIFVEDNWDIVKHISTNKTVHHCRVYWITNLIDRRFINYPFTYLTLKQALTYLQTSLMR